MAKITSQDAARVYNRVKQIIKQTEMGPWWIVRQFRPEMKSSYIVSAKTQEEAVQIVDQNYPVDAPVRYTAMLITDNVTMVDATIYPKEVAGDSK